MTLTTDLLAQWFARFNSQYFHSSLPCPTLALSKARTRFGYLKCVSARRWLLSKPKRTYSIHISTYYDCTEHAYQTVLLHEMIHYYISYHGLKDSSAHGPLFRKMMEEINRHGWHISVSTSAAGLEVSEPMKRRRRGRCLLLLVTTHDDKTYLSAVTPGAAFKIHDIIAHSRNQIVSERWYVSSDSRFDNFSRVRTLRGRLVKSEGELADYLAVMQPVPVAALFSGSYRL